MTCIAFTQVFPNGETKKRTFKYQKGMGSSAIALDSFIRYRIGFSTFKDAQLIEVGPNTHVRKP